MGLRARVVVGQRVPVGLVALLDLEPGGQREPEVGNDRIQVSAVGWSSSTSIISPSSVSSGGSPASSSPSMIVIAAFAFPSRSDPSVNRRNSAAASSSCW